MISGADKDRIEAEERYRVEVRASVAAGGEAKQISKDAKALTRVQSAQKTTNLRESVDNFTW